MREMREMMPPFASRLRASVTMIPPESDRERVGEEGREREPPPERSRAARKSYERETDLEREEGRFEVDLE